ncbi:MAG: ferritin-like domain-containing protein [Thermoanaerobacteraceae bacterium]|nr:ferritin-like domain-containing protein [Thermoanaerobacteraceae bacterium]
MPNGQHHEHNPNPNFRNMLREAITDELMAVSMYSRMANMVQDDTLKALIMSIAGDEYGHARTFMTMLELYPE